MTTLQAVAPPVNLDGLGPFTVAVSGPPASYSRTTAVRRADRREVLSALGGPAGAAAILGVETTDPRPADVRATASWPWMTCQEDTTDHHARVDGLVAAGPSALADAPAEGPAEDEGGEWEPWMEEITIELGPEAEPIEACDGPGVKAERFVPSAEEESYFLGFQLGAIGEYPAPRAGADAGTRRAFYAGRLAGFTTSPEGLAWQADMRRWRDAIDHEERMERAFGDPADRAADGERVEAMGARAFIQRSDWD